MYLSIVELVFNKQICAVMLFTDVLKIMPNAKVDHQCNRLN